MRKLLRLLIVEDSADDAALVIAALRDGDFEVAWKCVESAEAMRTALESQSWDIIISDYQMPQFSGRSALQLLHDSGLDLPFVVVSGTIGEEVAVEMMKMGAHDYLMKGNLTRLAPAVDRELREAAERRESKRAAELHRKNLELTLAAKLKDEFLAHMSHELRTPLNAILGMSEMLLEQVAGPLTPRQIKCITTIATSGTHLLELINDILDLSKIEAGKLELNAERVNPRELCESCLSFVNVQAARKRISMELTVDPAVAEFLADPRRLKQILVNLLTNAVKFTPESGRIGLSVGASADGEGVRFVVSDTGVGIARDDQKRLFRPFTQIDSGLTRKQEGTGLGLALVAKLCELHGGSVALESELGCGSRFIVTLPQSIPPWPRVVSAAPVPAECTGDRLRRALIIEDDPAAGQILENHLSELGISTVLRTRGEQACESALHEQPDVIFLDILLPDESGWVALTRLKEMAATQDIPVAVVSVIDNPKKSLALGAAAHFTKPVRRDALVQFLQRFACLPVDLDAARERSPIVLLAEDNATNAEMLGVFLQDLGYDMRYAVNGIEAIREAKAWQPAVILMDVQMPVMDGLTAIREIRSDPALSSIPIIALTGLAMPGDREDCLDAGATGYMSKPLKLAAVVETLENLARSSGGQSKRDRSP
jgi:signal transduction histidine kinase